MKAEGQRKKDKSAEKERKKEGKKERKKGKPLWRSWQRVRLMIERSWVRIPAGSNNDRLVSVTRIDGYVVSNK